MPTFAGPTLSTVAGIGALTLGGFLDEVVARSGAAEAIVFDDPMLGGATVRWTYDDLGRQAERIARALLAADVEPGDAVGIVMGNRPEAVAAIFGAASIGAVAAPMSTFSPVPELAQLIDTCDARVVLTQRRLLARHFGDDVRAIAADRPHLRLLAVLGEPSWDDLLASGDAIDDRVLHQRRASCAPDDPALVIFSSGTTSAPKGILHGHRSPALQCWLQAGIFSRTPSSRVYSPMPLFWTGGLNSVLGATLAAGGCWVTQETFDAEAALDLLSRERVTEPYALPHQTAAMAELPRWAEVDLSAMTCVYGKGPFARHPSVTPDPGWQTPVAFGMSETCSLICAHPSTTPRDRAKVGYGPVLPGVVVRIADWETGAPLDAGEEGELCVAGATLMHGYLGRDPADCFDADGYFHTGDGAQVDRDGIVHWTGRKTDMIKTGGANVAPVEVEVALRQHAPVKLSRVLGVPDDRLDEIVVACIVVRDGESTDEEQVRSFLKERLAAYKVPKRVLFFGEGEMPMIPSGTKVRDDALLELVLARLAAR